MATVSFLAVLVLFLAVRTQVLYSIMEAQATFANDLDRRLTWFEDYVPAYTVFPRPLLELLDQDSILRVRLVANGKAVEIFDTGGVRVHYIELHRPAYLTTCAEKPYLVNRVFDPQDSYHDTLMLAALSDGQAAIAIRRQKNQKRPVVTVYGHTEEEPLDLAYTVEL